MDVRSRLPPECSLISESDDEESFVVLGHSLPHDSMVDNGSDALDLIDASVVQQSINLTTSAVEPSFSLPTICTEMSFKNQNVSIHTTPNLSVDLGPDEIQQKVDLLVAENLKLKETLHQNNLAMKKQYGILSTWQNEVSMVHSSHKQKFDDIKKYVEKLKLENAELTALVATTMKENGELKCEIKGLKSEQELAAAKDKVDSKILKSSFENLSEFELLTARNRIKELEQQLIKEQAKLKELQSSAIKVQNLTGDLEKLKLTSETDINALKKQLKESEALQKMLVDEVKSLKSQLLTVSSTSNESQVNFEEQLMAAQMHITKLELLLNEGRETINTNEEQILKLKNEIKELTVEYGTLSTLQQQQLEVYRLDFEAEKQAKMTVGIEKEKIAEDLRNLQRCNNRLLEEVERLKGGDLNSVRIEASAPESYMCPKCTRVFSNYGALMQHVHPCIDSN